MDKMIRHVEQEKYFSVFRRMSEERAIPAEDIPNDYDEKIVGFLYNLYDANEAITEPHMRAKIDALAKLLATSCELQDEMQRDFSEKDFSAQELPAEGEHAAKHCSKSSSDAHSQSRRSPENWLTSIAFWIPRKQREGLVGDILEDCHELRSFGKRNSRIWAHVIWQFLIAVVTSIPASILSAIRGKVTPKD